MVSRLADLQVRYNIPVILKTTRSLRPNGNQILNIQNANTHRNDIGGRYTLGWDYDLNKNNS